MACDSLFSRHYGRTARLQPVLRRSWIIGSRQEPVAHNISAPVMATMRFTLFLIIMSTSIPVHGQSSRTRSNKTKRSVPSSRPPAVGVTLDFSGKQNRKPIEPNPEVIKANAQMAILVQLIVQAMAEDDYETAAGHRKKYNAILASPQGNAAVGQVRYALLTLGDAYLDPVILNDVVGGLPEQLASRLRGIGKSLEELDAYIQVKSKQPQYGNDLYANSENKFSIHFPPGWTIKQPEFNENIIVKAVYRRADQAFAALNIYRYVFDSSVNAASLSPIQLFNMTYAKQGELLDSGVEFIGNHRTIWLKMRLKQFDATIYAVGYLIARDHDALWIYGNTVLGGMEWFETNLPLLLESIRTFQSF